MAYIGQTAKAPNFPPLTNERQAYLLMYFLPMYCPPKCSSSTSRAIECEPSFFREVKTGNLLSNTNNSLQHLGKYLLGKGLTG